MFVMAAVNCQRAFSVYEKLCVIERLNNGKTQANISSQKQKKLRRTCATRALLILQPQKNQTLFQHRSWTQPSRSNFRCDSQPRHSSSGSALVSSSLR